MTTAEYIAGLEPGSGLFSEKQIAAARRITERVVRQIGTTSPETIKAVFSGSLATFQELPASDPESFIQRETRRAEAYRQALRTAKKTGGWFTRPGTKMMVRAK